MKKHKKMRPRSSYNNKQSYDDELDIVLDLLSKAKNIEKDLTKDFEKVLVKLCKLYKEQFPFYYKGNVLNKNEFQKLILSIKSNGSINNELRDAVAELTRETKELANRRLMAWLVLDYELTNQQTAQSLGVNPLLLIEENVKQKILQPWCEDGKTVSDRIQITCNTLEQQLYGVIAEGIYKGWTLEQMTNKFRTLTGVAANKAARLIRTETMAVYAKATKDVFLENGIEYVEIIGDAECGGICLDYVGESIPLREASIGGDLPPYHPNCACSFCAYTDFGEIGYKLEK